MRPTGGADRTGSDAASGSIVLWLGGRTSQPAKLTWEGMRE